MPSNLAAMTPGGGLLVAAAEIGGFPGYVQVLSCLEMARDARALPEG